MNLTRNTKRKLATIASVTAASMLAGTLYPVFFPVPDASLAPFWHPMLNGSLIGLFIGLGITIGEFTIFQFHLRRLRFTFFVSIQTLYYLITIHIAVFGVMLLHLVMFHGKTFGGALVSDELTRYLYGPEFFKISGYALVFIFIVTFLRRLNRMLGQNALLNFITGKYHMPVEEERVFMFLDLKASTTIAEKLGHKQYHRFLDDFFYDITPAIVESKGEIYQYVGDEVVVTWTSDRGLRDANCINCYFRATAAVAQVVDRYERRYGFVPAFKAGYHIGTVITGLIGDIKRDIVFHGDAVNTASRIRSECTTFNRPLLLSRELLTHLPISHYLTPESIGKIKLRGKRGEVELYSIKEAA